jgi:hypothetical protein
VADVDFHAHTADLFLNEKIMLFSYISKYSKLMCMHSVKFNYCPKSFRDVFLRINHENLAYELRYPNDFEVPRTRIKFFKQIPVYC